MNAEIFIFPQAKEILAIQRKLDGLTVFLSQKKIQNKTKGSKSEVASEKEQKDQ